MHTKRTENEQWRLRIPNLVSFHLDCCIPSLNEDFYMYIGEVSWLFSYPLSPCRLWRTAVILVCLFHGPKQRVGKAALSSHQLWLLICFFGGGVAALKPYIFICQNHITWRILSLSFNCAPVRVRIDNGDIEHQF